MFLEIFMDLRCTKTDCEHNHKFACMAKNIDVAKNTECKTYKKDNAKETKDLQDISRDMFEIAPDVAHYKHNDKMCVDCSAKCVFNKSGKCNANGITVLEEKDNASCGTFIKE